MDNGTVPFPSYPMFATLPSEATTHTREQQCQTDHEDENQVTRHSNDDTLAKAGLSISELKEQLDNVCNNATVDKGGDDSSSKVIPPPLNKQLSQIIPKSGTSSIADDEMDPGSYQSLDSTRMLTELCGEMKNCIRDFVGIMQEPC